MQANCCTFQCFYPAELLIRFEKCIAAMKIQICKYAILICAALLVDVIDAKCVF